MGRTILKYIYSWYCAWGADSKFLHHLKLENVWLGNLWIMVCKIQYQYGVLHQRVCLFHQCISSRGALLVLTCACCCFTRHSTNCILIISFSKPRRHVLILFNESYLIIYGGIGSHNHIGLRKSLFGTWKWAVVLGGGGEGRGGIEGDDCCLDPLYNVFTAVHWKYSSDKGQGYYLTGG